MQGFCLPGLLREGSEDNPTDKSRLPFSFHFVRSETIRSVSSLTAWASQIFRDSHVVGAEVSCWSFMFLLNCCVWIMLVILGWIERVWRHFPVADMSTEELRNATGLKRTSGRPLRIEMRDQQCNLLWIKAVPSMRCIFLHHGCSWTPGSKLTRGPESPRDPYLPKKSSFTGASPLPAVHFHIFHPLLNGPKSYTPRMDLLMLK